MTAVIKPLTSFDALLLPSNELFASWSRHDILNFLKFPTSRGWQIFLDETFSGILLISEVAEEIDVLTLAVREPQRRKGLANALMRHLIKDAYSKGIKAIFLDCRENNHPARSLYEHLGFKLIGKRENYYKNSSGDMTTAILYRLNLNDLEKKNKI